MLPLILFFKFSLCLYISYNRQAFGNPSMLILSHSGVDGRDERRALDEFDALEEDSLLRDGGILLATVDVAKSPMLAMRMGLHQ